MIKEHVKERLVTRVGIQEERGWCKAPGSTTRIGMWSNQLRCWVGRNGKKAGMVVGREEGCMTDGWEGCQPIYTR